MYPSSSSSTSHNSMGSAAGGGGLTRYGSAPGSFLSAAVESVIGRNAAEREFSPLGPHSHSSMAGHYFTGDSSESTRQAVNTNNNRNEPKPGSGSGLQRSYGFNNADFATASSLKPADTPSSSLVRQRSSPAGFFNHLSSDSAGGFSVTRGPGVSRLKPQLSFTGQDSLAHISEVNENVLDNVGPEKTSHSYANTGFGMDSWENNTNSIVFSSPTSKRAKNMDGDFLNYTSLESQFSLPQTMQIPEGSVPCKIRAKRGCATHPRSIAERERRTRISGKLKKLQDLVPNMDKQTSYSDMLDLAVRHIKGLQNQVQNLHKDLENCTCGCKPNKE